MPTPPANPACVWSRPGPAATNIVTPLADAYLDSVPMVCITGQVAYAAIGTDAFQECDTTGITRSITKHNMLVTKAEDIPRAVREAFHIATTGRPGPVLIDIPKNIVDRQQSRCLLRLRLPAEDRLAGLRSAGRSGPGRYRGRG